MIGFEWDDDKSEANRRAHGVGFEDATRACRDPFLIEWIDLRFDYGEQRNTLLGLCGQDILYVAYTERGDNIRIISARKATRHEQDIYFRQNAP